MDYSIVIPVYNSEKALEILFTRIKSEMDKIGSSFEIIFVEDCGTDNSWEVIKKIKKEYPSIVKAIRLNRNFGQHSATMCGFTFAKGERIITIDDDLQIPPEEIPVLIDTFNSTQSDITYGIYKKKQHDISRNVISKSVKTAHKVFMKGTGNGSSFRLLSRRMVDKVLEHNLTFIFIDEVMQWYTDKITYVTVRHEKRPFNKSGYNPLKLFLLASNLAYFYTSIPLQMMVYGGMIVSLFSFIMAIKFIIQKMFFDVPLGYTSVIVAILFSTSIIVFSLGVIGGYLSRIQLVQNKKPQFDIDEIIE